MLYIAAREGWFTVIEKLDNNEQILLMYLAGELPAGDRAVRFLDANPDVGAIYGG